ALAEDRGAEEHDGLSAVLREACTSALHASADYGLCCGFGDSGTDRIAATLRLDVLHSPEAVLTSDVVDGLAQFLAPTCGAWRTEASTHRAQDLCRAIALAFDRLSPGHRLHVGVAAAGSPDRVGGLLHVLGDMERVDQLHAVSGALGGQSRLDAFEGLPLRIGPVARPHDVHRRAFAQHAAQLRFQFADERLLVR